MYPLTIIITALLLIAVSSKLTNPSKVSGTLWLWIVFGVFISIYELFIIYNRQKITPIQKYWTNKTYNPFQTTVWVDGWREYSTGADSRYFEPRNKVYIFEGINAFIGILLLVSVLCFPMNPVVKALLVFQALNAMMYFLTLPKEQSIAKMYLGISILWLLVPLWLIFS